MATLTLKGRKGPSMQRVQVANTKAKADERYEAGKISGPQYERAIAQANEAGRRK